jgi:fatty-acid peroxygenase
MGLDGAAHRHRKALLLEVMTPESIDRLVSLVRRHWLDAASGWVSREVELLDGVGTVLTGAVCDWVGVPLDAAEVEGRRDDLHAMIDVPAAVGARSPAGRTARRRSEQWIGRLVSAVRNGEATAPDGLALERVATHRDPTGRLLDEHTAAVEILNLLRPVVAIDRFVVFLAHALHRRADRLGREGDDALREAFVQEVRRFYPFFPMTAARVRQDFEWQGVHFRRGQRVLLDLYGTNHDPATWPEPEVFDPGRFLGRDIDACELVPQGGGDHAVHHRCAGEWVTIAVMKEALRILVKDLSYEVPPQDLFISLRRIPAEPRSRLVIRCLSAADS